jgi:hypothetical protein
MARDSPPNTSLDQCFRLVLRQRLDNERTVAVPRTVGRRQEGMPLRRALSRLQARLHEAKLSVH